MKALFFILLLSLSLFGSQKEEVLLKSISEYAIRIGTGNVSREYVFLDPLCPHSKKYITMICEDEELQEENSYFVFLYRLPKFDSDALIEYIYQAKDKRSALTQIMIDKKNMDEELFDFEVTKKTLNLVNKIALVAKKLKVDRRPQMFTFYDLNP